MTDWVTVDVDQLNTPRQESIKGVSVTVYFSPYDMPEAVRGEYDEEKRRFVILFKYLGGKEALVRKNGGEDIRFGIGKKSGRLHEIEVDVDKMKANEVGLNVVSLAADEVEKAIKNLAKKTAATATSPAIDNYVAASTVIDRQREQIFGSLAGVQ